MPRSSRHKSSKHSSRDAREYSDSEKDSSSKDRKSKEESGAKVSKESGSGEKRKLDTKDSFGLGNGEYLEEYSTSKRRKEKVEDGVNDRWNGGEGTKKLKEKSSESKSKRRDESAGAYDDSDEVVKKSSGKTEGKHRESSGRKEGREGGAERERDREREKEKERDKRAKEGKTEKVVDGDDMRGVKQVYEKTDLSARNILQSVETENLPDRRMRRKRDDFGDGDKHQDDIGEINDRSFPSKEDVANDGKPKDEKHRDEKYRDKYREDVDRESRNQDDKQRDERAMKDHISSRSDDKHLKDDKDSVGTRPKKYKPQDGDRDRERDHEHDRDHDFDVGWDHDHESYRRDSDRDRDREQDRDRDRDHDHDRDWDWDRDRDRDRNRERDREWDHDRERNLDYDGVHVDDRNARPRDSRGKKRSPDDHDNYADAKSRGAKTAYLDMEKKSLSSSRIESDTDRGRSQSRQAHPDNNAISSRKRASPNTSSRGAADEHRQFKQEDVKYRDAVIEHRSKSISSKEVSSLPGASERNSKYRSSGKLTKMDDGHMGELSLERSSSSKVSPMGLVDRSPSSTNIERRYTNRSGARRSLDIEESGRRSNASMGARDLPSADDRPSWDFPLEKSLVDDSTSVDSSFYNRTSQCNSALIPPSFRSVVGSPSFMGSLEEDSRISTGSRYKRSGDPNLGRGQGNAWRGAPNWSSPLPNGYIPFQHGPPHGGFQAMLPQFPSPPLFGVRPSMEINHSGIPYHIPDADRFSSHLRPLGWQNIMDGSGPSHMHGWDGNNGVFRDEVHIYGAADWDQNRHPMNGRGWEGNADIWKGKNGDACLDLSSTSLKEDFPSQAPVDDVSAGQGGQRLQNESKHLFVQAKTAETKIVVAPSEKESNKSSPKTIHEKTTDPHKSLSNDNASLYHAYLSKLDISTELADPELYDQLVSLLNIEQSVTAEEDAAMLVNLKDGARAVPKSSSILLSSSLFPATSDSVFKRAMGIYRRQRASLWGLTIANGGTMNITVVSNIEKEVPHNDVNIAKVLVSNDNAAISDGNMLNSNEMKVEIVPIAAVQEIFEVTPSQEMDVDADTPDLKLESSGQGLSRDIPEKPMMVSSGDEMQTVPSKLVNSEDHEGGTLSSPGDIPSTAKDVSNDAHKTDEIGKMKSRNSLNCGEEGQGFGEAICDGHGLIFSVGSPESSGALKPGSNESESVILSRIHHSSESTH